MPGPINRRNPWDAAVKCATRTEPRRAFNIRIERAPSRKLAPAIFERGGGEAGEARLVADHLVDANMAGHDSHGVGMIPTYVRHLLAGLVRPNTPAERVRDDGAILVFDGRRGHGRRAAGGTMAAAIDRCRDTGIVVAGPRRAHRIGRVTTACGGFASAEPSALHTSRGSTRVVDFRRLEKIRAV